MLGRQVTIRVTPQELKRLQREASARNWTLSKYARRAIFDYLELKHELAETLVIGPEVDGSGSPSGDKSVGVVGDEEGRRPAARVIHSLLGRTEERIAASIDAQANRITALREDLRMLAAMVDRAYFGFLAHTAAIDPSLHGAAVASAQRRHGLWLRAVELFVRTGGELRLVPAGSDESEEEK